jgi:hypothetical protein
MWIAWAAWGCGPPPEGDSQQHVAAELDLAVEPGTGLDFGSVALGQSGEQTLVLRNDGTSDVLIAEMRLPDQETLEVTRFGSPNIRAGSEEEFTVQWTPETADLSGAIALRVGTSLDTLSDVDVPVMGKVSGPRLTLSAPSTDLGTVKVGCANTFETVATNEGTEDLVIHRLTLTTEGEFSLADAAGGEPQLPITLAPSASYPIDVVFRPLTEHTTSTTLEIESNDALAPTRTVHVDGEGDIEAAGLFETIVEGQQAVTAIINVNEWALSSGFGDEMEAFLPELFQGLHDVDVSYRLAIVMNEAGNAASDVDYIDHTFTPEEAVAAAEEMLEGASAYGDNDTGLQTCLNAIEHDDNDWLFEDELWAESRLNLMVINSDAEQSPGNAAHYLEEYAEYKDGGLSGTGDFVVHGIAAQPPGCSSGGEYGEASPTLYDAVTESDGVFIGICGDWLKSMPALIDGFTGVIETFVLEGDPAPWSIEVRIDGAQVFSGWAYDDKTRQIVFEDLTYPARGARLRVDYIMETECDG